MGKDPFNNYNPEKGGYKPLFKDKEYCFFIKEFKNYLLCRDKRGSNLNVAKPLILRRTPFDGSTKDIWNGADFDEVNYEYSETDTHLTRTAGGVEETITPPYMKGELIHILKTYTGLSHCVYLDMNVAGRTWVSASSSYASYFQASKTADTKITISAGRYEINLFTGAVAEEELTMSQTVSTEYIFLKADYNDVTEDVDVTLESSTIYPVSENEIYRGIIAEVEFTDNKISSLTQHHFGLMNGDLFVEAS